MRSLSGVVRVALLVVPLLVGGCRDRSREAAEARLRESVDALLPRVEALSGLEARAPVKLALRDRAELREYVAARIEEEFPPGVSVGEKGASRASGPPPDPPNLLALLLDLPPGQGLGYNAPPTKTRYSMAGWPPRVWD